MQTKPWLELNRLIIKAEIEKPILLYRPWFMAKERQSVEIQSKLRLLKKHHHIQMNGNFANNPLLR